MQKFVTTALALGAFAMPRIARAQGSLAGTWNTEFATRVTMENGTLTAAETRKATMILTVKGDSILGTWVVAAEGASPAQAPVRLRGTRSGGKFELRSDPVERTVNMGQGPQQVKMVSVYKFEMRGDVLEGTSQNTSSDGSFDGPELQFSAKRAKG